MVDFAELIRQRIQNIENPSKRTPTRSTEFNDADNIERQMQQDGHRTWGWIIYRCTYADDAQWAAFMERLSYYINATLDFHNGLDLNESLDVQVIEEPELLDGASPATVRQLFRTWAETAPQREQGRPAMRSQRYRYCLHVDQAALESVLHGPAPPEDELGDGYANIIFEGPSSVSELGCRADPYCMKISYADLMVTWYNLFRPEGAWETEYRENQIGRP